MAVSSQGLPALDLTTEEIEKLPSALRKKIEAALGENRPVPQRWLLVAAATAKEARVMRKTVKAVGQIVGQRREALSEGNIQRLVDLYLEGEARAEVDDEIELDNAELRADYLKTTRLYNAADIRARSSRAKPKNPSEPASRWKREKRVFAIRHDGNDLFPCFQFADGAPLARDQGDPPAIAGDDDALADRLLVRIRQCLARRQSARRGPRGEGEPAWRPPIAWAIWRSARDDDQGAAIPAIRAQIQDLGEGARPSPRPPQQFCGDRLQPLQGRCHAICADQGCLRQLHPVALCRRDPAGGHP